MTAASLAMLAAATVVLSLGFQQLLARTHLLEVALGNGLPPADGSSTQVPLTARRASHSTTNFDPVTARSLLSTGSLTVMVTASCTSCRRLVADLGDQELRMTHPVNLWFDRSATVNSSHWSASIVTGVSEDHHADIDSLGVSVFPYAVFIPDEPDKTIAHGPVADLDALTRLLAESSAELTGPGLDPG